MSEQCASGGIHRSMRLDVSVGVYWRCQPFWKVGKQPKYWPASAVINTKDGGGQFSSFGSMLWYFGFAIIFPTIKLCYHDCLFTLDMLNLALEFTYSHCYVDEK